MPAPPSPDALAAPANTVRVAFIVPNLRLDFGNHLRIAGGAPAMGEWSASAAPAMTWHEVGALPGGDAPGRDACRAPALATMPAGGAGWERQLPESRDILPIST